MSKIQIIGAAKSPLVWAARMAALEKGVDADFIDARPHSPEVDAIQPFGKIPVMRHGDLTLAESRAIALYIDGLTPENPLVPRDLADAARTEQWIMHFHTEYVPVMLGHFIVQYLFPQGADGSADRNIIEANLPALEKSVAVLERHLDGRDYLAGPFTLADIFFGPLLFYTSRLAEGERIIASSHLVSGYLDRLTKRPAFIATAPCDPSHLIAA